MVRTTGKRLKFRLMLPRALKPMQGRRQINAEPGSERLRSSVATATEPVRAAAHTVEEQVVWRGSDWARDQADRGADWARDTSDRVRTRSEAIRWPFERVACLVRALAGLADPGADVDSISKQCPRSRRPGRARGRRWSPSASSPLGGDRSSSRAGRRQRPPPASPAPTPAPATEAPAEPVLARRDAVVRPRQRRRRRRLRRRRSRVDRRRRTSAGSDRPSKANPAAQQPRATNRSRPARPR